MSAGAHAHAEAQAEAQAVAGSHVRALPYKTSRNSNKIFMQFSPHRFHTHTVSSSSSSSGQLMAYAAPQQGPFRLLKPIPRNKWANVCVLVANAYLRHSISKINNAKKVPKSIGFLNVSRCARALISLSVLGS